MKRVFAILLVAFTCVGLSAAPNSGLPADVESALRDRLCPQPKSVEFRRGDFLLDKTAHVQIATVEPLGDAQKTKIKAALKKYWKCEPNVAFSKTPPKDFGREGYAVKVGDTLSISAKDAVGVGQGLKTLRQLAEAARDGNGYVLPHCDIRDEASLEFRGMHICIFPETTLKHLEKIVRLASYYKFNYIVLEPWGVFPYKSHPEFAYADKKLDRAEFKKLINLCRELGITPIPQISILGHGSQSRVLSSKHAVLANYPEMERHFEPYGWSYCMTNPDTEKILKDLVAEIWEFYGKPPYIHFGCDEAYDMGTCHSCRKHPISELLAAHLKKFDKFAKQLGTRPIIWHDMLLDRQDARWGYHVASGNAEIAKALGKLPKNIVIADWEYGGIGGDIKKFSSPKYFKKEGFDVLVSPWNNESGIISLAKTACEDKLLGTLQTTWHHLNSAKSYLLFFRTAADCAWNGGDSKLRRTKRDALALPMQRALWQTGSDMEKIPYEANGNSVRQISYDMPFTEY